MSPNLKPPRTLSKGCGRAIALVAVLTKDQGQRGYKRKLWRLPRSGHLKPWAGTVRPRWEDGKDSTPQDPHPNPLQTWHAASLFHEAPTGPGAKAASLSQALSPSASPGAVARAGPSQAAAAATAASRWASTSLVFDPVPLHLRIRAAAPAHRALKTRLHEGTPPTALNDQNP